MKVSDIFKNTDMEEIDYKEFFEKRRKELEDERKHKITHYEAFINDKLKADLQNVLNQRESVYDELSKYLSLRNTILVIKESNQKEMETMINLGHEFFVHAKVPDTSAILVEVGLGFVVEFSHDEALAFITLKEQQLNEKSKKLTDDAMSIKAHIKVMLHGLSELMDLGKTKDELT